MKKVSVSIVLYNNPKSQILKVINSVLSSTLNVYIFLVDNSEISTLKELEKEDQRIEYIFNNTNLGYASGHNIAIKKSMEDGTKYHVVLNPDIYFEKNVLEELYDFMQSNQDVGNIMPKILYPNGEVQYLCKLLPTPFDLIFRRFIPFEKIKEWHSQRYELKQSGYNKIMNIPSLSGCFMFLRVSSLKNVGLFDERYFMYLEDVDLNRRIHEKYKTIFFPNVTAYHEYAKDSYKNKKLFIYHISSACKYFNKWGWVIDVFRDKANKKILEEVC